MEVGVENIYPDKAISGRTIRSTVSGVKLLNQLSAVSVTGVGDIRFSHFLDFCPILLDFSKLPISHNSTKLKQQRCEDIP